MIMELKSKELRDLEKELLRQYERYPSRHLDAPCEREAVADILDSAFRKNSDGSPYHLETTVDEHSFIQDGLDVGFVKHPRYLPAFLHKHDFFELLYVISGHCTNTVFNRSLRMSSGDICIIAPGVVHSISAFSEDDIVLNIIIRKSTFEKSFFGLLEGDDILSDFFKRAFYDTAEIPYLLFHTGNDLQLQAYVGQAYREYLEKKRFKKQMMNAMFSEFFIVLFRDHEQDIEIPNVCWNKSNEDLMYILRYMQAHFATVSLSEMAAFFNYSERHLQRLILNATGMTFRENIQKQKMTKAAQLLSESALPISQICEQLGFESFNNFRKIFYKYYQTTPSEFRKNHQPR